ncbi:MAG: dTDP-4-dehydrorhamnose 3,5-epimerase [Muribaculaceae bacterium]|nr:dTDP-4-dehydrorhamnose 3,5-epimerase [Muribaculaceae bacterium]
MKIIDTEIKGLKILSPQIFTDPRGYFFESYSKKIFDRFIGEEIEFVQDNESSSSFGVIRGLHFQLPPHCQAKLVRCVSGRVLDVAVDIRKGSPTYGRHVAVELSDENNLQFFIPHGFAHGFAVLSDTAVFQYKCDDYYHPESEGGISLLDPDLGIDWRLDTNKAILSDKDTRHPLLADFESPFTYF